ncbi:hypothetical protein F2981_28360 (plasmid) [Sinorhizobium meliloti]|nr:hypothetical protein [Sinorhizobium meliloti]
MNQLAEMTVDPTRVLGLHFFAPAHVMKLPGNRARPSHGDRALATGAALAKRLKKTLSFPASAMASSAIASWRPIGATASSCCSKGRCRPD